MSQADARRWRSARSALAEFKARAQQLEPIEGPLRAAEAEARRAHEARPQRDHPQEPDGHLSCRATCSSTPGARPEEGRQGHPRSRSPTVIKQRQATCSSATTRSPATPTTSRSQGGPFRDNWGLSLMRAREVLAVPRRREEAAASSRVATGARRASATPIRSRQRHRDGRQKNRRCELIVLPTSRRCSTSRPSRSNPRPRGARRRPRRALRRSRRAVRSARVGSCVRRPAMAGRSCETARRLAGDGAERGGERAEALRKPTSSATCVSWRSGWRARSIAREHARAGDEAAPRDAGLLAEPPPQRAFRRPCERRGPREIGAGDVAQRALDRALHRRVLPRGSRYVAPRSRSGPMMSAIAAKNVLAAASSGRRATGQRRA